PLFLKHRESAASVQGVRQLMGLLQKEGDVGLFISTAGFTTDAKGTARCSHVLWNWLIFPVS
ncbi:MAG: restriction endonuclease, partial [Deltaproteobacteria bacterium]